MKDRRRTTSPRAGSPVQIEIEAIAAGGEGVGRLADGRAAFVHRTAPGELVEASLVKERPRWARARAIRILRKSPDRRIAPCPHYADCGGCTLEHLEYAAQLAAKARIVADALRRIGDLEVPTPDVVASPNEFRYRNRVSFSLRRSGGDSVVAGFHSLHNPNRIVPIDGQCLLMEEPIGLVWDRMRAAWGPGARLLPPGEQLRLTLRVTSAGQITLLVEGGHSPGRLKELVELVEGLDSVWHRPENDSARHVGGPPGLPESWGDERFELGGTAFLQVNRAAARLLEDHVADLVGDPSGLQVIDAYCGIGLHARRLAQAGASVMGIELDPEAVRIAEGWTAPGLTFHCGRVEAILSESPRPDLLILNPPRAGVDAQVIDHVRSSGPARVVYISCDPATLARDLKRLGGAYSLDDVRCFDLFPQTAHVETVVLLRRVDGGGNPA